MIFRTLLFFVLMYLLVKVISRLFLSSSQKNVGGRKNSMYHTFKHFSQFQNQHQNQQRNNRQQKTNDRSSQFEEIEEAEFEDITEESSSAAKTPD